MSLAKRLRIDPDKGVDLARIDPASHEEYKSEEDAKVDLERHLARISTLQRKLYASRTHSLLVVLQGIDGAGKDGTCWHVISGMDPQGVNVVGFKQPLLALGSGTVYLHVHPWNGDSSPGAACE